MKKILFTLSLLFTLTLWSQNSTDTVVVLPFELSNLTQATEETDIAVKKIREGINTPRSVHSILSDFERIKEGARSIREDSAITNLNNYNLWALTDLYNKWVRYEKQIEVVKKDMSDLSVNYQENLKIADQYTERWHKTKEASKGEELPEVLTNKIIEVIAQLQETNQQLTDSLTVVLEKFDIVSSEYNLVVAIEQQIKELSDAKKLNVFARDAKPLFADLKESKDSTGIAIQITGIWTSTYKDTKDFIKENKERAEAHLVIIVLITLLFYYFRYAYSKSEASKNQELKTAHYLINKPLTVSLVFNLFISFWVYPNAPSFIGQLILLAILVPIILLLPGLLEARFRKLIYIIAVLYLLNQTEEFMPMYPITQRMIILIESLFAAIGLIYALRPKAVIHQTKSFLTKWLLRITIVFLLFALLAVYGNISGSLFLSRLLSRTIVISGALGAVLYLGYQIIESLIEFFIISKSGQSLNLIQKNGEKIKTRTLFYIRIAGIFLWVRATLSLLGILSFIKDSILDFLEIGWTFGTVPLSVGQVIEFILILVVFSFIANILRDLLEIEILPRFNIGKGIPMAAGLITRYFVLLLGFLMAVAAAGISLDKFGFIVGALGVGIGFGLQNVVGNFVSGLILIFERPVRVGDIVLASNVEGTITEIGIRASRIRDWNGAEVIVPNSELITLKVTNWTLSDAKRRREVIVRCEYGTDPNQVMDIIRYVMKQHPGVIDEPAPNVYFLGFKEYSVDFRCLFWVTEKPLATTSEVTLGIHDELKKAGIKVPIPKQEFLEGKKPPVKRKVKTTKTANKKPEPPTDKTE